MTTVPPLSDNIREFLGTIEAALDYADLNLGVNFGLDFTDPHPEFGIGAMFCQLDVQRFDVSQEQAKDTLVVVVTDTVFWMWIGEIQAEIDTEVEVGVIQGSLNGAQELANVIGQWWNGTHRLVCFRTLKQRSWRSLFRTVVSPHFAASS